MNGLEAIEIIDKNKQEMAYLRQGINFLHNNKSNIAVSIMEKEHDRLFKECEELQSKLDNTLKQIKL